MSRRVPFYMAVVLGLTFLITVPAGAEGEDKTTICHPPDTLTLKAKVAAKHLDKHPDDYLGPCEEPESTPTSTPNPTPGPAPIPSLTTRVQAAQWLGAWCWFGFGDDQVAAVIISDSGGWCQWFGAPPGNYWVNTSGPPWTYFTIAYAGQTVRIMP